MSENKNHMIYTAENIAKYFAGQLSPQDMYAFEKAALDDEFLADAMEGYGEMKNKNWENTLVNLKQKFATKNTSTKVIPMRSNSRVWYRVAAAVLLIGSISAITYQIVKKNSKADFSGTIAKTGPTNPQLKSSDVNEGIKPILTHPNNDSLNNTASVVTKELPLPNQKPVTIPGANPGSTNNNEVASNTNPRDNNPEISEKSNLPKNEDDELGSLSTPGGTSGTAFGNTQSNFVAQVVGPNNNPLPFANISIKKSNVDTYTDARGNIKLVSGNSVLSVDVNAAGYSSKTYNLRKETKNKIVLDKDVYGDDRQVRVIKDDVTNVEPVDGWNNYNAYIQNNIDIPQKVIKKNIRGDVEISFEVLSNGKAANTEIEKSLCTECDKETKKVIEHGPLWRVKKGQSNIGFLKVRF